MLKMIVSRISLRSKIWAR